MKAGVPVAPVSVPYSLMSSDFAKLRHVVALTQPKMIFADHGDLFAKALAAVGEGAEIVTQTGGVSIIMRCVWMTPFGMPVEPDVKRYFATVS